MKYDEKSISESEIEKIWKIEENYFNDFKAKDISGKKLSKVFSAFSNTSGGDIYIGVREETDTKKKHWEGFENIEDANAVFQVLESIVTWDSNYNALFLRHPTLKTYVLQITVFKSQNIIYSTEKIPYIRRGAQSIPCSTPNMIKQLEMDKGISSFEDEVVNASELADVLGSVVFSSFKNSIVPNVDSEAWLKKQRLFINSRVTVAGELLFSDEPQILLPKRSAIKVYRYKTAEEGDRDTLVGQPKTIEGDLYSQIYAAVQCVKETIENIRKLEKEFEKVEYPEETLHEIITNAVLHRDYSLATDIQIRIYDNRVEVESPGRLPGHVTVNNILDAQSARNPKLVRLINKFPNAPNKDVGEGLNTAFDAMTKLRLKQPIIEEHDKAVLVIIKHERLASPEEIVVEYLSENDSISNKKGRELTGIKSENTMKRVFYRLRDVGLIQMTGRSRSAAWVKTEAFSRLAKGYFSSKE